jgi:hypothetical protein
MKPSDYIADFDSATGFLRALSRFLHGKDFPALGTGTFNYPGPRHLVQLASKLPVGLRDHLYSWSGWLEAIRAGQLQHVDSEDMARWMVEHYPRRRYPAMALGSSSGALVHLCAALGIPWLPQTVLIPVREHQSPDEPLSVLRFSEEKGQRLLAHNPDLQLHHMHDAAQDRLMLRHMTYFRVKRRRLGRHFSDFITRSVEPGGTLFLVECGQRWPTKQVASRHVFQHGAVGGITPEEFQHGGPRVEEYLRRYKVPKKKWDEVPVDGESPEAEWGFEPALREDVEELARRHGYRVRRILYNEADELSPLVADLYRWWYQQRRMKVSRLVVESFIETEPWWVLRTGSVPLWLKFNTEDCANLLERYLDSAEPYDFIHLMLMQHGTDGPGQASIPRWRELLARARKWGDFLGVNPTEHPRDFASFVRYHTEMKKLPARYPMPGPLSLGQLEQFLEDAGDQYPVRWEDSVQPRRPSTPPVPPEEERGPWVH